MGKLKLNDTSKTNTEFAFYASIFAECVQVFGDDLKYIPLETTVPEKMFGEFLKRSLKTALDMSLFIEETDAFGGGGMMLSKFGVQFVNQLTCYGDKAQFKALNIIPKSGDLIYIPKTDKLFQIESVQDEVPFYPMGGLMSYKIEASIYGASGESSDTGIDSIDDSLTDMSDLIIGEENEKLETQIIDMNVIDDSEKNNFLE